jgi:Protein of unknown function (DUF2510)
MSGQIAAISPMSIELVATLVGLSMLVGAVDLCRQPGWAWKQADESKIAYLILVVLLPLIGLGMYVFRARPAVVAASAAGQAPAVAPGGAAVSDPLAQIAAGAQPRPTSGSDSVSTSMSAPTSGPDRAPALVSASRAVSEAPPPAGGGAFRFDTFEEVASLSEQGAGPMPRAQAGVAAVAAPPSPVGPTVESMEIISTFFSSGATRTLRPPRLRNRSRPLSAPVAPETLEATVSPGWRSDPTGIHEFRFWDGRFWTENVADHGRQSRDATGT